MAKIVLTVSEYVMAMLAHLKTGSMVAQVHSMFRISEAPIRWVSCYGNFWLLEDKHQRFALFNVELRRAVVAVRSPRPRVSRACRDLAMLLTEAGWKADWVTDPHEVDRVRSEWHHAPSSTEDASDTDSAS